MDEHAPSTIQTPLLPDGHEPEGGVDYTPGIEHALDGYAPDSESWLRARDQFQADLAEYGSVDAAVRVALASVEEDAETTYDEAEAKFWNYVEGEGGPHAQYGGAIGAALDGYAPDGASWLQARDNFFGSIREGADIDQALDQALHTVTEGAESSPGEAAERFWTHGSTAETSQETPAARERRVTGVRLNKAKRVEAMPVSPDQREAVLSAYMRDRALAIELAPPSRDIEYGIDSERIDRFFEDKGLKSATSLLLTHDEIVAFKDRLLQHGVAPTSVADMESIGQGKGEGVAGMYIASLGLVITAVEAADKMKFLGDDMRAKYLTSIIVHEKAHASEETSGNELVWTEGGFLDDPQYGLTRSGSSVGKLTPGSSWRRDFGIRYVPGVRRKLLDRVDGSSEGCFFEEGFAEMIAGEYVRTEMGLPDGVLGPEASTLVGASGEATLPSNYVWPAAEVDAASGQLGGIGTAVSVAAHAATGLNILIEKRPELYKALIDSRSSVEGLRDIARIVNSIEPGLYVKLRKLKYTQADFEEGLLAAQRAGQ